MAASEIERCHPRRQLPSCFLTPAAFQSKQALKGQKAIPPGDGRVSWLGGVGRVLLHRQDFLNVMMEEWARDLGHVELRNDAAHNFIAEPATPEATEEGVAALFSPLSMLVAQFGVKVPHGTKIKATWPVLCGVWFAQAAFLHINALAHLFPDTALQKDVNSWSEFQAGVLRAHAAYLIRLWRKTRYSSKCPGLVPIGAF